MQNNVWKIVKSEDVSRENAPEIISYISLLRKAHTLWLQF